HMSFHYPLMPRLFLALRTEDSYPIVDIIEQTPPTPADSQWALFLRNHDELGLQMVSEEEKDYLFKAFAGDEKAKFNVGIKRRLAPLLDNDHRKIELLHAILFTLPGTPVLYYGDEIGMGDNVYIGDRFGVRTPMQWNANQNAGFSSADPQSLFLPVIQDPMYRHEVVNVTAAEKHPNSLLGWMKGAISMRKNLSALGRGSIRFIESSNTKILAFSRTDASQTIIVVANLSQFAQAGTLNFAEYRDWDLTEVFSQNRFLKPVSDQYPVTMGPYGYFWLQAEQTDRKEKNPATEELPLLETADSWQRIFENYNEVRSLERKILPLFMKKCRWFGGKAKVISRTAISQVIPLKVDDDTHFLLIIEVHYAQRLPEFYFTPVTFVTEEKLADQVEYTAQSVVCRALIQGRPGFIMDSSYDRKFRDFLFTSMEKGSRLKDGKNGVLEFNAGVFVRPDIRKIESRILKADQSNTAIIFGDEFFFKFYRKIEQEINPDLEIIRFLTEHTSFPHSPRYAGSVQYRDRENNTIVFGLLQQKVDNQGDAWVMTMDSIAHYYERVVDRGDVAFPPLLEKRAITFDEVPDVIRTLIGREFYDRVVLLGQRTAEMHIALASDTSDSAFRPEKITTHYQRSLYTSLRRLLKDRFNLLEGAIPSLDQKTRELAENVLSLAEPILELFGEMYRTKVSAMKTRIHGDYHLGQVLFTGDDFIIIDFEGEPGFSFSERRLKKSPLKDVAGMMRSFHYAAYGKILLNEKYRGLNAEMLERAAEQWQHYCSRFFLGSYLAHIGSAGNLSQDSSVLIRTFLLEKAIYELGYELNARPDWVNVPLKGIHYLVNRYLREKEQKIQQTGSR
ncbi:MAG: putative maltokinase, partial [Bacteroidota bacterium]|nr:putative maltokinase [Bacteroidota bacterium]